jgi:predicted phage baseplate assembly protein
MEAGAQAEDTWVRWQAVADFYGSGPQDRHYVLDALSGVIRFGDGRQGRVPPPGQNNLRITYRTGGGTHGNRDGGSVVQLKSTIPYVASVTNSEAAAGGSDRESLQRARERGPRRLRHRDRAVTAQDLEDLALEADPTVARARALAPTFSPYNLWLDSDTAAANLREHEAIDAGRMGVVVVPNDAVPRPTPSLSLLRRVRTHLLARCSPTADLWVAGPEWVEVKVMATVVPQSAAVADTVHVGVMAALDAFLHPLTGAGQQTGWAFARAPRRSDFYAVIEAVAGVDHVRGLRVQSEPQLLVTNPDDANLQIKLRKWLNASAGQSDAQELDPVLQRWRNRSLVYSGRHEIQLTLESA